MVSSADTCSGHTLALSQTGVPGSNPAHIYCRADVEPLPGRGAEHPQPSCFPGKEPAGWVMLWRWDRAVGRGGQINKAVLHGTGRSACPMASAMSSSTTAWCLTGACWKMLFCQPGCSSCTSPALGPQLAQVMFLKAIIQAHFPKCDCMTC